MRYVVYAFFMVLLSRSLQAGDKNDIHLSELCPPSFVNEDKVCRFRHAYQQFASLQNSGVGGLKTALPTVRDGFSPQQIDLGRYLFFDPLLSKNHDLSCASCHDPDKGFSDGRAQSVGHNGVLLKRSAPSLWNVAFLQRFFWDGRAKTLEEQMQGPLYDENEMANTPAQLVQDLNANQHYRRLFQQAFKHDDDIALPQIYSALAAFESSLISLNSRYDWYALGVHDALSKNEIAGLNVFRSFVARCAECHTPPLFTNQQIAVIGAPDLAGLPFDVGNEKSSGEKTLRGGFKVPSLRNIAHTAPYMHNGAFSTLNETVRFYSKGRGHAVPKNEKLLLHWHIWKPELREEEFTQLESFLQTLTDVSFKPAVPTKLPSGLMNK